MTETPGERVSDAAREKAMHELSQHLSTGRLTLSEFDERTAAAAAATTTPELAALFADLPGATPPASAPDSGNVKKGLLVLGIGCAIIACLVAQLLGGWRWLLFMLVAVGLAAGWLARSKLLVGLATEWMAARTKTSR